MLKKLQVPYVEIDQIIRDLIEKGDVETNSEMHARSDSAKDTIVDNLEHRIRDLPSDEPQVRALQNEVDGQKHVCTFPEGAKFAKSVMLLDGNTQEARLVENPKLDVENARSVVVKKALIVVMEGSPATAHKFTSFDDPAKTVKTRLPTLPNNSELKKFSICKLANNSYVILSGGLSGS